MKHCVDDPKQGPDNVKTTTRPRRPKRTVAMTIRLKAEGILFALICPLLIHITATEAAVPGQYIAKMYTETLGRAPDPTAWNTASGYFETNGCGPTTLRNWGAPFFSSAEFKTLEYDNAATALLLYRAIFNREPDPRGYSHYLALLDSGTRLNTIVSLFYSSSEFSALARYICSAGSYSFATLGSGLAIRIPTPRTGGYDNVTEAQLQALLDSAAAGSAVYLTQQSVVYLTEPLVIPAGVTLATYGMPTPHQHAKMARLVRAAAFASPMVQINLDSDPNPAGMLKNIWVDGQRGSSSNYVHGAINIEIYGGTGAVVDANFIDNSLGWSNVHSYGSVDGRPCGGNTVTNNVITAYSGSHYGGNYTDGLSIGCENTLVRGNQILDATDVGIVVFTAAPATQKSLITGNTVVSAGNSSFGALAFDPLWSPAYPVNADFTGASFANNILWSSPDTHFIIGLAIGSRPWYGTHVAINGVASTGNIGYGASATGNTTAGVLTNFGGAITVSGMDSATVQSNAFRSRAIPHAWTNCPIGNVLASVSAGLASGSLQGYADIEVNGCMSDSSPQSVQSCRLPGCERFAPPAVQKPTLRVGMSRLNP
jgi:hypothetical protein